jgi:predicted dehydrogenase
MVDVAILGAGGIAERHASALGGNSSARIVAVHDTRVERAEAMASAYGGRAFARAEDAVAEADLVYVLTPPTTHRELAVLAMQAGKHVVCEKPLAATLEDGRIMLEAAQTHGVKLMVAFNMRFKKGFRYLKEIVDSGRLGRIYHFWSHRFGLGVGTGYNWRTDPELMCGMAIESLSHDIDLMRFIVGDPLNVRSTVYESRSDLPGFDTDVSALFTLAEGSTALIHASWSSHLGGNARGVLGTKGAAIAEGPGLWESRYLRIKTEDMAHEERIVLDDPLDMASYVAENEHFVASVDRDLAPLVTGEDGFRALTISYALLEAHRRNETVAIP